MMVAAPNVSTIMRMTVGIGGPRSLQGLHPLLQTAWIHFEQLLSALDRLVVTPLARIVSWWPVLGVDDQTIRDSENDEGHCRLGGFPWDLAKKFLTQPTHYSLGSHFCYAKHATAILLPTMIKAP